MSEPPPRRPRRWTWGVARVPVAAATLLGLAALTAFPERAVFTRTTSWIVGDVPADALFVLGRADPGAQLAAAAARLRFTGFT